MSGKKRFKSVAVLMGGPSAEREVSLKSGQAVAQGLRDSGYDVVEIDVPGADVRIPEGVEGVFIALHGEFGEDGQVQALLERRGLPYTGSSPAASADAFDKRVSKRILSAAGIRTPAFEVLGKEDVRTLPLPVVAKPVRQGSSIGVHRVLSEPDWPSAKADALKYDNAVLVERYIEGRELTVGIVGDDALPVIEIVAPNGWYDYGAKYTAGKTEYRVPAVLERSVYRMCQEMAVGVFRALKCRGFARVDFRLSESGELYVLELNSIPGFTETSLLPKAAICAGMTFAGLCDRIMSAAGHDGKSGV